MHYLYDFNSLRINYERFIKKTNYNILRAEFIRNQYIINAREKQNEFEIQK